MKRFIILLNLVFIIGTVTSNAQDTLEITTAIKIGLENNFDIKISEGEKTRCIDFRLSSACAGHMPGSTADVQLVGGRGYRMHRYFRYSS